MFLEVIAKDLNDIETINNSKANRIEFCRELEVGGLTPTFKDIFEGCEKSKLPVNIIVRNTARDFIYSQSEKREMLSQIEFIKTTKANGIVIGALNEDHTIDLEFLKQVIDIKGDLEITFHKAFDEVTDFIGQYELLNDLNISNVLTSGGPELERGLPIISKLISLKLKTKVLVGGGVTKENFESVAKITDQIHVGTSARENLSWDEPANVEKINSLLELV